MKLYISILLLLLSVNIKAQTIRGKVVDEKNNPIGYANIILQTPDSVYLDGSVTNTAGEFIFSKVPPQESYCLRISYVGYEVLNRICKNENIGIIQLSPQTQALAEVTVTGSSSIYKMKGNSLITTVQNTVLSHLGTANKVLEYIPGLQNGEGSLSVFGKGHPIVYLNGRVLNDLSELDRLKSSDIATIELIKNPGAEYNASSQAVVKIKTLRKAGEGMSLDLTSYYQQAHKPSWQGMIQSNYRSNNLDIFGTMSYINYSGYNENKSNYTILSSNPVKLNNTAKEYSITQRLIGKLGFDYYFTPEQSIGAYYSYAYYDVNGRSEENTTVKENSVLTDNQFYHSTNGITSPIHRINAYYSGHIGKVSINFNNELYLEREKQKQQIQEVTEANASRNITTRNNLKNKVIASNLVLQYKKGNSNWKVGTEYNNTLRTNDFNNVENIIQNSYQKIVQNQWAAFGNYTLTLKKWELEAGLRYEHYQFDYYKNHEWMHEQSKRYNDLYPNLSISHSIGRAEINLSYSIKTQKPSYSALDGNIQYISRNIYHGGNPLLQPAIIHDIQLSMLYKGFSASLDYIQRKRPLVYSYQFYDEDKSIILSSYENYPKADIFQAEVSYSKKIGIWKPQLTIDMSMSNYKFMQENENIKLNAPYISMSFNNIFQLPHNWYIYLFTLYQSKGCDEYLKLTDRGRISLNIIKSWKNFDCDILFNDIFHSYKKIYSSVSQACTFWSSKYSDTQNIQITLRYNLNATRSKYKGGSAASSEMNRM